VRKADLHSAPYATELSKLDGVAKRAPRDMAPRVSKRSAMRTKSFPGSAWLGLVFILLCTMSNNAASGPNNASMFNGKAPNTGPTVVLRLKGAIDGLLETVGLRRAPDRGRLGSGSEGTELGPLD
jgi:hypothetical protein